ncbi:acyltransferase family protein [Roseimaritima sediminicola]|uniref:acyltransferase family protein n=1 Tax=Roseimaritima sediminicola TaxID=2662066 RepID=UPI0012984B24|nr:acyltransferase family protein [Roseimaritima sediminicola]
MNSKSSKAKRPRHAADPSGGERIAALDALRGLAILLMVLDHVAGMLMDVRIEYTSVRFWTRLSMPLFCVLMGYFLDPGRPRSLHRFGQIALAAVAINVAYLWLYREVEILGSLLVAYTLFLMTGRAFVVFVAAAAFYPLDPSTPWFDYPLSIVLSFVAQGMILRHGGGLAATVSGCLLASGIAWIGMGEPGDVNHLLFYFILPATAAVHWAARSSAGKVPVLDWLGRHPLSSYLVQYYVIFAVYFWFIRS